MASVITGLLPLPVKKILVCNIMIGICNKQYCYSTMQLYFKIVQNIMSQEGASNILDNIEIVRGGIIFPNTTCNLSNFYL